MSFDQRVSSKMDKNRESNEREDYSANSSYQIWTPFNYNQGQEIPQMKGNVYTLEKFEQQQKTEEEEETNNFINYSYTSFVIKISSNFLMAILSVLLTSIFGLIYALAYSYQGIFDKLKCFNLVILKVIVNMNHQYSEDFKQLMISPDLLYFELIDRQNLQECVQNKIQFNDKYKILKLIPQQANKFLLEQAFTNVSQNKVWNTGYLLLYDFSSSVTQKSKSRIFSIIVNLIAGLIVLAFIIIPFVYLCLELENVDQVHLLFKITFFFLIFASNLLSQFIYIRIFIKIDDFYRQIVSLTALLEISNNFEDNKIQRNFSTINIFCIQSILTWQQMRELTLEYCVDHRLQGHNLAKYYIIDNKFLLSYVSFSIIQRILASLVNLFNQFSGINKFLKYNKDQFYKILQTLTYFKQTYQLLRKSAYDQITCILQKNNIQYDNFQNFNQFQDALNQVKESNFRLAKSDIPNVDEVIRDDTKTQSIIDIKTICEIKRNANYYLREDYKNQIHLSDIQLEEKYLMNLINEYKNAIKMI
ncbi:hypothetical protein ABPG72_022415 [Tetrahymena utriculariae]